MLAMTDIAPKSPTAGCFSSWRPTYVAPAVRYFRLAPPCRPFARPVRDPESCRSATETPMF